MIYGGLGFRGGAFLLSAIEEGEQASPAVGCDWWVGDAAVRSPPTSMVKEAGEQGSLVQQVRGGWVLDDGGAVRW